MNWLKRLALGCSAFVLGVGCNRQSATASPDAPGPAASTAGASGEDVNCAKEGFLCAPKGLAFTAVALGVSDACGGLIGDCPNPPPGSTTARLTQPESGKICMAGVVKPGGWADLVLAFTLYSDSTGTKVLKKFDADARGITQVGFTIDSPPRGGIKLEAAVTTQLECPGDPMACFTYGFSFRSAAEVDAPMSFTEPGPQVAPFTRFKQGRPGVSQVFDTTALENISFGVGPGEYDFCIRDFKFLDAAGNAVVPLARAERFGRARRASRDERR